MIRRIGLIMSLASCVWLGASRQAVAQFGPQPAFGSPTSFPVFTNPYAVAAADLNHDGHLDLVVTSGSGSTIRILLGDGHGGFTAQSPISVGTYPEAVAVADLNGDGNPDIAVANSGSNDVSVLLGDGLGGFTPGPGSPLTAGTAPLGLAIADVDGDGIPDLVVANDGSNNVSVLPGNGSGGFGPPAVYAVGTGPRGVAVGDLNGDGLPDIVATNYNGGSPTTNNVSVLLAVPTGGFQPAVNYTTGDGARSIALADLNEDGHLDAVVANVVTAGYVSVLLGNGDGTFQPKVDYLAGPGGAPTGVAVGDFNLDGKPDVAVTNLNLTTVTLFNGSGADGGSGQLQSPGTDLTAGSNPAFIAVGDFDEDGKPDLAVTGFGSGDVSVLLNTLVPSADMSVTNVGPASVTAGQNVVYTITVTNNGPNTAFGVQVADSTPAGLTFVSNTGDCTTAFPCTALGTLTPGQSRTITSTFLVPLDYSGATPVQDTASVSTTSSDPNAANNSATASTSVTSLADLAVTESGPAFGTRGANAVYTIVITNAGPSPASSVEVTNPTPAGLTFVSNTGDCTTAFPCSLGVLAAGANRTITATFSVPVDYDIEKPIVSAAIVTGASVDPDMANNSATATTNFGAFYTLTPCRLVDTRSAAQPLQPSEVRVLSLADLACGIPVGAQAVSLNVTVTQPTAPGYVTLFPADVALPTVSTSNFAPGQTRANNAIVVASADGQVKIKVRNGSAGTVHLILDVNGYFQ
ncbi:MAG TPA: FG-GAP-like repeat-containing protein [Vicinamibacteria bacterium]|nr:FG-GAP-like repeat-containing protein [Vicinamibacteria bacterium]